MHFGCLSQRKKKKVEIPSKKSVEFEVPHDSPILFLSLIIDLFLNAMLVFFFGWKKVRMDIDPIFVAFICSSTCVIQYGDPKRFVEIKLDVAYSGKIKVL